MMAFLSYRLTIMLAERDYPFAEISGDKMSFCHQAFEPLDNYGRGVWRFTYARREA